MNYFLPLQVRFADTDAQGHVFFGNYFVFFDEAVSGLLRSLHFSYQEMRAQELDLVYAHAECDYRSSATFEEMLHIHARVARIGATSVTVECEARRAANEELVVSGKVIFVIVNTRTGEKARVPDSLRAAVGRERSL